MANDLSIQWIKRGDEWRQYYLSQDGMYLIDEASRSEVGNWVPAHLFFKLNNQEHMGLDVRDDVHAE